MPVPPGTKARGGRSTSSVRSDPVFVESDEAERELQLGPAAAAANEGRWGEVTYLSDTDLALRWKVSRTKVFEVTRRDGFPLPLVLGPACARWDATDVFEWELTQRQQAPVATPAQRASVDRRRNAVSNMNREAEGTGRASVRVADSGSSGSRSAQTPRPKFRTLGSDVNLPELPPAKRQRKRNVDVERS